MRKFDLNIVEGIRSLLTKTKHIAIATHLKPDGDTLGAAFALRYFFRKKNIESSIICPRDFPFFLNWMRFGDEKKLCPLDCDERCLLPENTDAFFIVDHNNYSLTVKTEFPIDKHPAPKVLIDHHPNNLINADYIILEPSASSACELIYELFVNLDETHLVDDKIASCLYTGIMTDTGNFEFGIYKPSVFNVLAELMEKGIDKNKIYEDVYHNFSKNRMRLLGFALNKKLKIFDDYPAAYIILTQKELKRFKYQTGDTEGMVNYAFSMSGIKASFLFIEKDDHVKISFRSKGDLPINSFAMKYFDGGGHLNAAGGRSYESLSETVKKFKKVFPVFLKEQQK